MESHLEFPSGIKMPIVGLGTWQANDKSELANCMNEAFNAGYRHFDTAYSYKNETMIGQILKEWLDSGKVRREELFIVTKLPGIAMKDERVEDFLKKSLQALQLHYVDLYLIHSPIGFQYVNDTDLYPTKDGEYLLDYSTDLESIWKAMEKQVDSGLTKSIGISNFNSKQIERIVKSAKIPPANLQIEAHVYFQQKPLREICKKYGITVCAYGPLGSPGRREYFSKALDIHVEVPPILEDPVVAKIAKKKGKSTSQILLRFLVQQKIAVIPKSTNLTRLKENIDIFSFELSPEEMKELEELDKGVEGRSFKMKTFKGAESHPENPESIEF